MNEYKGKHWYGDGIYHAFLSMYDKPMHYKRWSKNIFDMCSLDLRKLIRPDWEDLIYKELRKTPLIDMIFHMGVYKVESCMDDGERAYIMSLDEYSDDSKPVWWIYYRIKIKQASLEKIPLGSMSSERLTEVNDCIKWFFDDKDNTRRQIDQNFYDLNGRHLDLTYVFKSKLERPTLEFRTRINKQSTKGPMTCSEASKIAYQKAEADYVKRKKEGRLSAWDKCEDSSISTTSTSSCSSWVWDRSDPDEPSYTGYVD